MRHIGWLMGSMLMLLVTACSSDSADDTRQEQQEEWEDARIELRGVTRAGTTDSGMGDIHVFLQDDYGTYEGAFKYHNETATHYWRAQNLKVKPGTHNFWLYGYMPAIEGISGQVLGERRLKQRHPAHQSGGYLYCDWCQGSRDIGITASWHF